MKLDFVPVEDIRALEMVFPNHLSNLRNMIIDDQFMKQALIVEKDSNIVLDGSHRHIFLLMEGYKYAPVHYVDYNDPNIRIGTNRVHRLLVEGSVNISKEEVVKRGISGNLFEPRTTRHFFPFLRPEIDIPLSDLGTREPVDVRNNIMDVDIIKEIEHNKEYVKEIESETDEILRYLMEGINTKKYLLKQIENLEKNK